MPTTGTDELSPGGYSNVQKQRDKIPSQPNQDRSQSTPVAGILNRASDTAKSDVALEAQRIITIPKDFQERNTAPQSEAGVVHKNLSRQFPDHGGPSSVGQVKRSLDIRGGEQSSRENEAQRFMSIDALLDTEGEHQLTVDEIILSESSLTSNASPQDESYASLEDSSDGSSSLASESDVSDDRATRTASVPLFARNTQKRLIVDLLMRQFWTAFVRFTESSGSTQDANNCGGIGKRTSETEGSTGLSQPSGSSSDVRSKRKFEDIQDEDGGDDQRPRQFPAEPVQHEPDTGVNLACPYFKRNWRKYQRWRSCPGPGWKTVHRLK